MSYDYIEAMKLDIKEYIDDEIELSDYKDREEFEEYLHDTLWSEDSVTGNASCSYTFSRLQAREYVIDNIDALSEACYEFGIEDSVVGENFLGENWEWMDVIIRCYYLDIAISEVLDDMGIEYKED